MKESEKLKEGIMIVLESNITSENVERRFLLLDYLFERYRSEVCVEAYYEKKKVNENG